LCRGDVVAFSQPVDYDVGTGRGERAGDAEAYSTGRAGDERDLALEISRCRVNGLRCVDVHVTKSF
jgi:hypothetical protein